MWETANDAIIAEGKRVLIDDPARFDGVTVLGSMSIAGGTPAAVTSSSLSSSI